MKPVEFKHQNIVFAKDQPEYQPLPALRIDSPVWLSLMSFNKPLTPSYLAVNRKEVYSHPDDEKTLISKVKTLFRRRA